MYTCTSFCILALLILLSNVAHARTFAYWKHTGVVKWNIGYEQLPVGKVDVFVYNVDMEDTTTTYIDQIHKNGGRVVCYFSAGTFEKWRSDAYAFPRAVKGNKLSDWDGEKWLDVRNPIVRTIMTKRIQTANQKHCDAVDPDNVDGYQNPTGFRLSYNDQLNYNMFLMETAHTYNMSVSLKNNIKQIKDLHLLADFAVNEQCVQYNECNLLKPFALLNKTIFHIEYTGSMSKICWQSSNYKLSTVITDIKLNGVSTYC